MIHWPKLLVVSCIALALGVLAACGSSPSVRFYALGSQPAEKASPPPVDMASRQGLIAIGPVEIADYLDRPQIVRRSSESSITLLELDRWAGSLQGDVARVLVGNLSRHLSSAGYVVLPWETIGRPDSRMQVALTRFEGTGEQTVVLDALWTLHGKEAGEILAAGREVIVEPVPGAGVGVMVEAMNRALATLSRRLAVAVEKELAPAG